MRLVLFDMDHTLIPGDTGSLWVEFLAERKLLSIEDVLKKKSFHDAYRDGTLDIDASYSFELNILNNFHDNLRHQLINDFFAQKMKPLITKLAINQVAKHREAGDYVVIITASLKNLAIPIADFFGADHLIASYGKIDETGMYTGEVELEPCLGRGKLVHLEEWLVRTGYKPQHYIFYSDSYHDLPLLEQVDEAIAVDPDEKLRNHAKENNWQIISFIE